MELVIDGIIFSDQTRGGVSRVFSEMLPRVCDLDKNCHIKVLVPGRALQPLPSHSNIQAIGYPLLDRALRPRIFWRNVYLLSLLSHIGDTSEKIWHSTYYSIPKNWMGKSVVTVYDMIYEQFPNSFNSRFDEGIRIKKKRSIDSADRVICISKTTSVELQKIYKIPQSKLSIIPLACSDIFQPKVFINAYSKIKIDFPFLLYIGNRNYYKNFSGLLHAYSKWKYKNDVTIIAVGNTWTKDEKKLLARLGIEKNVINFTNVDDQFLCYLYNQATAFVYPSLFEGFGIPLLEAMNCGCPIVASSIPSSIEVAGNIPIYFHPGEVDAFVSALTHAIDEGRNSKRTNNGLLHAKQYSWNRTAEETLIIYRELLSS